MTRVKFVEVWLLFDDLSEYVTIIFLQAAAKAVQQAGQLDQQVTDLQAQQMQMLQFNEVRRVVLILLIGMLTGTAGC